MNKYDEDEVKKFSIIFCSDYNKTAEGFNFIKKNFKSSPSIMIMCEHIADLIINHPITFDSIIEYFKSIKESTKDCELIEYDTHIKFIEKLSDESIRGSYAANAFLFKHNIKHDC